MPATLTAILSSKATMQSVNSKATTSQKLILAGILIALLSIVYWPAFTSDYLMNDELHRIGQRRPILPAVASGFIRYGRALSEGLYALVYRWVGFDPFRVQLIRFLSFASLCGVGIVLLRVVGRTIRDPRMALCVALLICTSPPFQGPMAYSMQLFCNSVPSIWLSLAAGWILFSDRGLEHRWPWLRLASAGLLLIAAMQVSQVYAWFGLVPLSWLVLTEWERVRLRYCQLCGIAVLSLALAAVAYKLGLEHTETEAYKLGTQLVHSVDASLPEMLGKMANPLGYWSAFKLWSYPFPWHRVRPHDSSQLFALGIMTTWLATWLAALRAELHGANGAWRAVIEKWGAAALCLVFAGVWLAADSPLEPKQHRPHILMTLSGVVLVMWSYAARSLTESLSSRQAVLVRYCVLAGTLIAVSGACSDFSKSYVSPRVDRLEFVRSSLASKPLDAYTHVLVVVSQKRVCAWEPCGPWLGFTPAHPGHQAQEAGYQYALATLGGKPGSKHISILEEAPNAVPEEAVLVDWQAYLATYKESIKDPLLPAQ